MQIVSKACWYSDRKKMTAILSKFTVLCLCCEQYWTSPGGNTPQGTNYTANYLPSRKLYKLDEPDM